MLCGCGRPLLDRIVEESSTAAHDPDVAGLSASYHLADVGGFLFVPQSVGERESLARQNFRLCDPIQIAACESIWILNLRLYLTIAQLEDDYGGEGGSTPVECEVTTPGWHFVDATVSWHLRTLPGSPALQSVPGSTSMPAPSVSSIIYDGPAALLTNPAMTASAFGGAIPGHNVGSLGTMRNKPFLWARTSPPGLRYRIDGPASVNLYASVLQTDPATRPQLDPDFAVFAGEAPEDQFLRSHPLAQYRHIGGSIVYEREVMRACRACKKVAP